ncbi:MAG: universal stress protein [Candidatus Acetothermia bacterium]
MNDADKKPEENQDYEDVLISVANPETAKQLVTLAHMVTTDQTTLHIMHVTPQGSFPEEERAWREGSELVMDTTHFARRLDRVAKPLTVTSGSIPGAIINTAKDLGADLILMGWFGRITPVVVRRSSVVNKVLKKASCDVSVLKSRKDLSSVESIMMPVGPNKPRPKRLSLVNRLVCQSGAGGELVHVLTGGPDERTEEEATQYLEESLELVENELETRIITSNTVLDGLLTASEDADLIVLGPGREWVFNRFLFGRTADNLTNRVESSVVMFKGKEHKMVAWSRGLLKAIQDLFS